ncbi:hypothetical protein K491DRAFT_697058 [Lophiostoma macrostomum CBS 122681]|uniref:Major facilitator superfamily (MFS) profile domain-containing protein n=1 Tax=Lophiostoma macrostomum CBS 122681 TaxID=1314788 RepID=A0A6A6SWA0_9PLEO|nr:hypothetical protein K491DRAFT_697058 [Lophiostoma macrostomum CBS 122681]
MPAHKEYPATEVEVVRQDVHKDNPLDDLETEVLDDHVTKLWEREFKGKNSVTEEELLIGARLARSYGNHMQMEEYDDDLDAAHPRHFTRSVDSVTSFLQPHDWKAIKNQQSKKFWNEPKDLIITLVTCCMASMTQGWDQAANGNTGWPKALGVKFDMNTEKQTGPGVWEFGAVNAMLWFTAAALGPIFFDPICYATGLGRRGSVALAACFSLAGSIGGSRCTVWWHLLIWRGVLGIGIGAKASIVPIWETEVLPPAKRGRVLVSWQTFTAAGLFAGSIATYILRDHWQSQILSGGLPALILIVLAYLGCESPRWLIVKEKHLEAFETLVRLRKERVLAAEEFCYIYFQIQTERAFSRKRQPDFNRYEDREGYTGRIARVLTLGRNRRAGFATAIVMIAQQLSGINILAFLATFFFTVARLAESRSDTTKQKMNIAMSIGFAAANAVFSAIAYFFIEPLPVDTSINDLTNDPTPPEAMPDKRVKTWQERHTKLRQLLHGRRRLMLISLAGGTITLAILAGLLSLSKDTKGKSGAVVTFVIVFAVVYSFGAGSVPFLYSAEVWPNEARDVGMSIGVFWNFMGAGLLALFVPQGLHWSSARLFGIFTGLSAVGFLLVFFFVPGTDRAISLEEMSKRFEHSLYHHAFEKGKQLIPSVAIEIKTKKKPVVSSEKSQAPQIPELIHPGTQ